jgi:lipoprotein NlpI
MGKKEAANQELSTCLDKLKDRPVEEQRPIPVFNFLLDQLSESEFVERFSADFVFGAAQCECWYCVGMKRLFAGDKKGATEAFRKSLSNNEYSSIQYHAAKAELRALQTP